MNNKELKIVFQAYQIIKYSPATTYSPLLEMAAKSLNIFFNDMAKDSEDSQHNRSQELEDQKFEEMGDNQ